jgi:16S rRNA (uracil1498-N3)-methyltransferase
MASLAQFFFDGDLIKGATVALYEQTAKHIVQVLRKQAGDKIKLSNGNGLIAIVTIIDAGKKKCSVIVDSVDFREEDKAQLHLAVAFTKNSSRNEWLLEKATELGVRTIIPLSTTRTEKEHLRFDRLRTILVSAMLQSQGHYLPVLSQATSLKEICEKYKSVAQKFIAHCIDGKVKQPLTTAIKAGSEMILLIGPEGDFTEEEVSLCETAGFKGVSLGTRRLRTETAALSVCTYFNLINHAE